MPKLCTAARTKTFNLEWEEALEAENMVDVAEMILRSENCLEFPEIYLGVAKAGGIVAPLNFRLLPQDLAQLINYVRAEIIVSGSNYLDMFRSIRTDIKGVKHIIGVEGSAEGAIDYDELLEKFSKDDPAVERGMEDLFCLIFTGGTTGLPKGAMLTHRNLYSCALLSKNGFEN